MATYMMLYTAPDNHLEFLKNNPALFDSYLGGEMPDLSPGFFSRLLGKQPPELPDDWPRHELEAYSPEISHRQVNAFHYILNGTNDYVENVGSIFQTWFRPRHNSPAIVIDGENFAFLNRDVKHLLALITALPPALKHKRLDDSRDVSEIHGGHEFVENAFDVVEKACDAAVSKGQGLLWTNR